MQLCFDFNEVSSPPIKDGRLSPLKANPAFVVPRMSLAYEGGNDIAERRCVLSSIDAANLFFDTWPAGTIACQETFRVMMLSRGRRVLGILDAHAGGIGMTLVDVRLIFAAAVSACASSIICAHNHPSGSTNPSQADISITRRLKAAGTILDIEVLDHLIVTPSRMIYSMADENVLPTFKTVQSAAAELGLD